MAGIKVIVFDWDETLIPDFPEYTCPMVDLPGVELIPGITESYDVPHKCLICCVTSEARDICRVNGAYL